MNLSHIIGAFLAVTVGIMVLIGTQGERIHPWCRSWWMSPGNPARDRVDRLMGWVVGCGFIVVGVMILMKGFGR